MKNQLFLKVWILLILLTISTALVSNSTIITAIAALLILVLSVIKFMGVSFYFMELRKAHIFWKVAILIFLFIFTSTFLLILK